MGTRVAQTSAKLMTIEEWSALDEDEEGELVDGLIEKKEEVPTFAHELVVSFLIGMLRAWFRPRGVTAFRRSPTMRSLS